MSVICVDCNHLFDKLEPCPQCGSHRVDMWFPSYGEMEEWARVSYHDRQGQPMTMLEYVERCGRDYEAREEYKKIAYTEVGDMAFVSTIWLGINHRFGPGPPLIFETMSFMLPRDDDPPNPLLGRPTLQALEDYVDTRRYSTEEEARAGHEEVVAEVERFLAEQRAWIEVAVAEIEGEQ